MKNIGGLFHQLGKTQLGFKGIKKKYSDQNIDKKLSKIPKSKKSTTPPKFQKQTIPTPEIELSTQGEDFISTQNGDNLIIQ